MVGIVCRCGKCGQQMAFSGHVCKWRPREERYWAKVDRGGPDECWPWTGGRDLDGYGVFGGHEKAHRLAWEKANGPIPAGLWVLHKCDNPPCCNAKHLFLGDAPTNVADMVAKRRHAHGTRHPHSKLNEDKVRQLRQMRAEGVPQRAVAAALGVSRNLVRVVERGKNWKHVPMEVAQ